LTNECRGYIESLPPWVSPLYHEARDSTISRTGKEDSAISDKLIKIEIEDYMLRDRLFDIAKEYDTTTDTLVNHAIRRFVDDIRFFWALRKGVVVAARQDEQV
jgi:hypothetical protein